MTTALVFLVALAAAVGLGIGWCWYRAGEHGATRADAAHYRMATQASDRMAADLHAKGLHEAADAERDNARRCRRCADRLDDETIGRWTRTRKDTP